MILQALVDYYDRKANDPESGIAPQGWERKELPFLIVIDRDGKLVNVENTQEMEGKKKRAKSFLVPQSEKRASGIKPNFLWDNVEYVVGKVCKGKESRVAEQHKAFKERLEKHAGIPAIDSVLAFLARPTIQEELEAFPAWADAADTNAFVSFKLVGQLEPVFRDKEVMRIVDSPDDKGVDRQACLVSGTQDVLATLHPAIKGVQGTNTTGGNIVSFNFPAACSFGKSQGANAPVGETTAFKYTTALNTLLGKDSKQKMTVGDATMVFWSEKKHRFENDFASFLQDNKDDPDQLTEAVTTLFQSIHDGAYTQDKEDTRFYILGLAPNSARISIRFWHVGTIAQMANSIATYFDDLSIAHGPAVQDHLSLWRLLVSVAAQGKTENIPPKLAGDVMRSILGNLPFPESLLQATVQRTKIDNNIFYEYSRAKLIKACLNRKWRVRNPNNERSLNMSLDKDNINIGYRLGRLFATLERIQQDANPGINATIRDKFYAAASSTPATVFGNLMRLKNHHLSKIENPGRVIFFEKLLGEIIYQSEDEPGITAFPAHLSLADQGQFAIGYYHQKQDFFSKKVVSDNQ